MAIGCSISWPGIAPVTTRSVRPLGRRIARLPAAVMVTLRSGGGPVAYGELAILAVGLRGSNARPSRKGDVEPLIRSGPVRIDSLWTLLR
jgi:hypothetical protein